MDTAVIVAVLTASSALLAAVLSHVLTKRHERQRQVMRIRAEMLKPLEDWLSGAERVIGILGDTLSAVALSQPMPITYNLEERRKVAQFMGEKTNVVFGILKSDSLATPGTRKLVQQLAQELRQLDDAIKHDLLPLDDALFDVPVGQSIPSDLLRKVAQTKESVESYIQSAYSLIAQIKTELV